MNGEKGQALPLAMAALAIGALVVVPFLSHAGSSLISSRVHAEIMAEQSASDAGIEHAIWELTRGGMAGQFSQPGEEMSYQLGEMLNGHTTTVTVTANATSAGGTPGTIGHAVTDGLFFDYNPVSYPDMIHVSGDIYAIAYQGAWHGGYLKTVSINGDGDIGSGTIDTLEFDNSDCAFPDIINVSGDVYAIAYQGQSSDGFLKTVSIASDGNIDNHVTDTLEFDNHNGQEPVILPVSGDVYAIAYRGQSNDGFVRTVSIASSGAIGNHVIDTLEYDTGNGYEPDFIHVSGDVYAIAYRGSGNDGYLKTISINTGGAIGNHVIDTLEFDTKDCAYPSIINISGDVYAIAYQGQGNSGLIKTVSIAAGGDIGHSVFDTFEFDTNNGQEPGIIYVGGDVYAVAYRGYYNGGVLKTVAITAGGDIGGSAIDTFEFETWTCYYPDIIRVGGGVYAIAYSGPWWLGELITINITTEPAPSAAWEIVSAAGATTIRAFVNTDNTTATIVSWQIE